MAASSANNNWLVPTGPVPVCLLDVRLWSLFAQSLFAQSLFAQSPFAQSPFAQSLYALRLSALRLLMVAWCLSCLTGCTDGPFFQMKKLSPWHQREWKRDRELGPTYSQRLEQLNLLNSQIAGYSPDQQAQWGKQLEQIATKETSPELRARAVRILAKIDGESTLRGLNAASTDEVEKVRLAVCEAWATRQDEHARNMLLSLASTDESDYVRQSAIAGLAKFDTPEVRAQLADLLDHKNPAIQHQSVLALRQITGRDFSGDFDAWKRYLNGEEVPDAKPASLTARLWDSLSLPR